MSTDKPLRVDISNDNKQFEAYRRKFLQDQARNKELIKVKKKDRGDGTSEFDFDIDEMLKLFRPLLQKKQVFNAGKVDEPKRVIGSFKYDFPLYIGSEIDLTKNELMRILFDCWASEKDNTLNIVINGLNYWLLNLAKKTFELNCTVNSSAIAQRYECELTSFDFVRRSDAAKKTLSSPLVARINIFASSPDACIRIEDNGYFFIVGEAETDLYEDVRLHSITDFGVESLYYMDKYGVSIGSNRKQLLL